MEWGVLQKNDGCAWMSINYFDNIKYMNILISKHFWKFLIGLLAMMFLGLSIAYGTSWYERQKVSSEANKQQQEYEAYEARYLNDTYGSTTPEGTLQLFIDALKKNDIDLAVKYFVIDDRDKWSTKLQEIKNHQGFSAMIYEAGLLRLSDNKDNQAIFSITNSDNLVETEVVLGRLPNGTWKLIDL